MNSFYIFLILWVLIAICTFVYLFFQSAPYGRHIKKGWGINISARLGWVVMESPCVVLMIAYGLIVRDQLNVVHEIFLLLWLTHYIHRTFIYPFAIEMTNPKMPISIALSAFCFNIINVSIQAFGIFYFTEYASNWISSPTFILGVTLFFMGMFINIKSDYFIASMKKKKLSQSGLLLLAFISVACSAGDEDGTVSFFEPKLPLASSDVMLSEVALIDSDQACGVTRDNQLLCTDYRYGGTDQPNPQQGRVLTIGGIRTH